MYGAHSLRGAATCVSGILRRHETRHELEALPAREE